MSNINKTLDYVIIASVFSSDDVNVLIGYKNEKTLDNLYIINEFTHIKDDLSTFKMLFDIFNSNQKPAEFVDFFATSDKFYAVFEYTETEDIKQKYRKDFNIESFDDRCIMLESILIRLDKLFSFPKCILGCLTEPENIRVDSEKNLHFIYNLKYLDKYSDPKTSQNLIYKNIGNIIKILLKPETEAQFNKSLHIVVDKCKRGVYPSIPPLVIELKKAEKISAASSWFSYIKYQLKLRQNIINRVSKTSLLLLIAAGISYLVYSQLNAGQKSGSAAMIVSIGNTNYNGNKDDESDKNISPVSIDNQTGETKSNDIVLSEGLDIEFEDYIVQHGDSIPSISESYYQDNKFVSAVASFNGLDANDSLTPGTIIKLPNRTAVALYTSK